VKQQHQHSLRIIVADDEVDTVATLAELLRQEGYEVVEATRGPQVIKLVREQRPDALILDIDMPGMSGYTVAREVREMHPHDTPLLICISGKWVGQTDKMLADLAGFNHFHQKPCDLQILLRLLEPLAQVRNALGGSRVAAAPKNS